MERFKLLFLKVQKERNILLEIYEKNSKWENTSKNWKQDICWCSSLFWSLKIILLQFYSAYKHLEMHFVLQPVTKIFKWLVLNNLYHNNMLNCLCQDLLWPMKPCKTTLLTTLPHQLCKPNKGAAQQYERENWNVTALIVMCCHLFDDTNNVLIDETQPQ